MYNLYLYSHRQASAFMAQSYSSSLVPYTVPPSVSSVVPSSAIVVQPGPQFVPLVEIAFQDNMWWSLPEDMSLQVYQLSLDNNVVAGAAGAVVLSHRVAKQHPSIGTSLTLVPCYKPILTTIVAGRSVLVLSADRMSMPGTLVDKSLCFQQCCTTCCCSVTHHPWQCCTA